MTIEVGTVLATKYGQSYTNAIVIDICKASETIKIMSDFGNIMQYGSVSSLMTTYDISKNWLDAKQINYPLPTITERIREQINKLEESLQIIEKSL